MIWFLSQKTMNSILNTLQYEVECILCVMNIIIGVVHFPSTAMLTNAKELDASRNIWYLNIFGDALEQLMCSYQNWLWMLMPNDDKMTLLESVVVARGMRIFVKPSSHAVKCMWFTNKTYIAPAVRKKPAGTGVGELSELWE